MKNVNIPVNRKLFTLALKENQEALEALKNASWTCILALATHPTTKNFIEKNFTVKGVVFPLGFSLKPHQERGLEWMRMCERKIHHGIKGGILGFFPGLGKTLTTIVHCLSTPKTEGQYPSLIVCKKTVIGNVWWTEITEKIKSSHKILFLYKDFIREKEIQELTRESIKSYDLVITTYETCINVNRKYDYWKQSADISYVGNREIIKSISHRNETQALSGPGKGKRILYDTPWHRVVCDESQNFANSSTKIYRAMIALVAKYRWCLSGTIVRNYETDIYSQLCFLGYSSLNNKTEWQKRGIYFFNAHNLKERVLQMTYQDAGIQMPLRIEYEKLVSLENIYREVYESILDFLKRMYDKALNKIINYSCILALLTKMRQCLIAPYLMTKKAKRAHRKKDKIEAEITASGLLSEHLDSMENKLGIWCKNKQLAGFGAPKITKIFELIDRVIEQGEKVIIFSTFVTALDLIAEKLVNDYPEITFQQIDGSVIGSHRIIALNKFKRDSNCHVLLTTYKVCSEGLNITEACYCIRLDSWWNNATHEQAVARLWRMGQTKTVSIFKIFSAETLDVRIRDICRKKDMIAANYRDGTQKRISGSQKLDLAAIGKILE
jgi:SNF2 family DNA or RNA helicase